MAMAHQAHKAGQTAVAIAMLSGSSNDWLTAGREWLQRRALKKASMAETR